MAHSDRFDAVFDALDLLMREYREGSDQKRAWMRNRLEHMVLAMPEDGSTLETDDVEHRRDYL